MTTGGGVVGRFTEVPNPPDGKPEEPNGEGIPTGCSPEPNAGVSGFTVTKLPGGFGENGFPPKGLPNGSNGLGTNGLGTIGLGTDGPGTNIPGSDEKDGNGEKSPGAGFQPGAEGDTRGTKPPDQTDPLSGHTGVGTTGEGGVTTGPDGGVGPAGGRVTKLLKLD